MTFKNARTNKISSGYFCCLSRKIVFLSEEVESVECFWSKGIFINLLTREQVSQWAFEQSLCDQTQSDRGGGTARREVIILTSSSPVKIVASPYTSDGSITKELPSSPAHHNHICQCLFYRDIKTAGPSRRIWESRCKNNKQTKVTWWLHPWNTSCVVPKYVHGFNYKYLHDLHKFMDLVVPNLQV